MGKEYRAGETWARTGAVTSAGPLSLSPGFSVAKGGDGMAVGGFVRANVKYSTDPVPLELLSRR